MDVLIAVIYVLAAMVCGFVGSGMLRGKGRDPLLGFAIGFVLGIIGVVLTVAMDPSREHQLRTHAALTRAVERRSKGRGGMPQEYREDDERKMGTARQGR